MALAKSFKKLVQRRVSRDPKFLRALRHEGISKALIGDQDAVLGSGNVFRDLGHPDADREHLRALLAAKIIGALDARRLTAGKAQNVTGVSAAEFSRIRKAEVGRFTIDRLMSILAGLGQNVDVTVKVSPRRAMGDTNPHWGTTLDQFLIEKGVSEAAKAEAKVRTRAKRK
jgi:predicted XRE-type DNA-binding protein